MDGISVTVEKVCLLNWKRLQESAAANNCSDVALNTDLAVNRKNYPIDSTFYIGAL